MQHICISIFCNGRGHGLWWICSMETDYCYSLHYLAFQKTPTICSSNPLEFTMICEQCFLLWQILDSIHKIFLGKNDTCFNKFSFEIPRFRQQVLMLQKYFIHFKMCHSCVNTCKCNLWRLVRSGCDFSGQKIWGFFFQCKFHYFC